ncbi:MAG TPA: hypothetical protein VH593_13175 [Ktedonobacteraceae bacterium]
MAQSKKELLKRIRRECRRLEPRVRRHARERHSLAPLNAFSQIQCDVTEMLWELQYGHLVRCGTLEHSLDALRPVTAQQVASLYERWRRFTRAMLAAL